MCISRSFPTKIKLAFALQTCIQKSEMIFPSLKSYFYYIYWKDLADSGMGALEPTKNLKWGNEKPDKYNAIIKIKCFDGSQLENLLLTVLKQMCWVQLYKI
ncbi:hypothetical protein VNO80_11104 [Phaseolus coccineus]|uniref:Uncharacterized protein n=1 Tax=Phaseolus coccineus TaxID=3886 RepID=A0AAN9N9P0_PHACN